MKRQWDRLDWRPQPTTWIALILWGLMLLVFPELTPELAVEHGVFEWMQVALLMVAGALLLYFGFRCSVDREMRWLWLCLVVVPVMAILREIDWGKPLIDYDEEWVGVASVVTKRAVRDLVVVVLIVGAVVLALRTGAHRAAGRWLAYGRVPALDVILFCVAGLVGVVCEEAWVEVDRDTLRLLEELCESGAILLALGILVSLGDNQVLQPSGDSEHGGQPGSGTRIG